MTLRELWNGLLDFNLMWVLLFIVVVAYCYGIKDCFYWVKLYTKKEVDDYEDGERVQYTRSFMSLVGRWVWVLFILGLLMGGALGIYVVIYEGLILGNFMKDEY